MAESLSKFYQLKDNDLTAANEFRDRVKFLFGEGLSDDETIAKIEELTEQSQLLSEIGDILNRANTECLDHYRSKQEEKIVLTGFRRLCDIHAALFKKRSDYEIYGSRIINDLLNSVDLQAQKQANQNRFDSATYDPFQDKYKLENIDHAISFRATVASYLGCSYDRNEAIAKIEQLTGDKDREIERLNRCLSGIASFLDLPSDAKQPDICFKIMELKENQGDGRKKLADLRHDLIVANKVIARLVGE
jgi:hypothetical protein